MPAIISILFRLHLFFAICLSTVVVFSPGLVPAIPVKSKQCQNLINLYFKQLGFPFASLVYGCGQKLSGFDTPYIMLSVNDVHFQKLGFRHKNCLSFVVYSLWLFAPKIFQSTNPVNFKPDN
jgi:hypothetical protein